MARPEPIALVRTRPTRIALPRAHPGTGHRARAPPSVIAVVANARAAGGVAALAAFYPGTGSSVFASVRAAF